MGSACNLAAMDNREQELEKTGDKTSTKDIVNVLVIVTGGTLSMVQTEMGYMVAKDMHLRLKKIHCFHDEKKAQELDLDERTLITPVTPYKNRVQFKVFEFEELIDSSNIQLQDQINIAEVVEKNYKDYDGFVIIHGTDTMAYTSSLLSFMFENMNKTVVLTGSQIPISELRNDAIDNLLGSLIVAGTFLIPEVVIYFDNKVMRGNRATKDNSSLLEAFSSPNMLPLARLDVNFTIDWTQVLKYHAGNFNVFKKLEDNISFITMSPCMNIKSLELVLKSSKAVIIAGYGLGNLPSDNKILMDAITNAIKKGTIVVIKT